MATYKLVRGGEELDLNDLENYIVMEGFFPLATVTQYGMGGGLGLSRSGGDVLYDLPMDRKWKVPFLALGATTTETGRRLRLVQNFIDQGGVVFEYNPAVGITHRPVWGQGPLNFAIKAGKVAVDANYGGSPIDKTVKADMELMIGPYAEGLLQQALNAQGGIWEDDIANYHQARGTAVLPATTNLFTNPVFQYYNTFSNGWTKGGDLAGWQCQLAEGVLFGDSSYGLCRITSTGNNILTQSLTAANTNTHSFSCYARRADGGVINSGVLRMYYAGALTTSYQALPNGWYRLTATAAGVAAARDTGVSVEVSDINLYVIGFQMEEAAVATPLAYGDMVGCKWSGTMHASSTTRLAGALYQSNGVLFKTGRLDQGTMRMAWRWYYPSTFGTDQFIAYNGVWQIYYQASDDKIYFTDGTNTISTAAQTFAAGDLVVLHFVFGPGSMKIYKNGAEAATGSAYASRLVTDVYFGCDNTTAPVKQGCQTWLDLTMWNEMASAVEIAADYTEVYAHISGGDGWGQRLNGIPWLWTEDGDRVDQYCDGTHLDTVVVGGVDGDAPARSAIYVIPNAADLSLLLALNSYKEPRNVRAEFYDASGTVDAAALGGQTATFSVATTSVSGSGASNVVVYRKRGAYYGRESYILASLKDAGSNLMLQERILFSSSGFTLDSEWKPVTADTTLRKFLLGPVVIPDGIDELYDLNGMTRTGWMSAITWQINFKRSSGGSAAVNLDFYRALVGKVAYCELTNANSLEFIVEGEVFLGFGSGGITMYEQTPVRGALIEFEPGEYNYLTVYPGDIGAATAHSSYFVFAEWVQVAPRWKML